MARVLIVFAHPALERSRIHRQLIRGLDDLEGVTFHDLYEAYPDFNIDIAHEQKLLLDHDLIVLQHPFYWYSTPAIVKQWEDLVLEHGWAYGTGGTALHGKRLLSVISTGGGAQAYQPDGYNRYTMRTFLTPLEQTARLCGMEYLPPFLIQGTHRLSEADIAQAAALYHETIIALRDEQLDLDAARQQEILNPVLETALRGEVAR